MNMCIWNRTSLLYQAFSKLYSRTLSSNKRKAKLCFKEISIADIFISVSQMNICEFCYFTCIWCVLIKAISIRMVALKIKYINKVIYHVKVISHSFLINEIDFTSWYRMIHPNEKTHSVSHTLCAKLTEKYRLCSFYIILHKP